MLQIYKTILYATTDDSFIGSAGYTLTLLLAPHHWKVKANGNFNSISKISCELEHILIRPSESSDWRRCSLEWLPQLNDQQKWPYLAEFDKYWAHVWCVGGWVIDNTFFQAADDKHSCEECWTVSFHVSLEFLICLNTLFSGVWAYIVLQLHCHRFMSFCWRRLLPWWRLHGYTACGTLALSGRSAATLLAQRLFLRCI